ncbi:hypothetical protein TSAR_015065, partial [Trichomalopsis sarcophagae]
ANAGDSSRQSLACTYLCGTDLYSKGSPVYSRPRDGFNTLPKCWPWRGGSYTFLKIT